VGSAAGFAFRSAVGQGSGYAVALLSVGSAAGLVSAALRWGSHLDLRLIQDNFTGIIGVFGHKTILFPLSMTLNQKVFYICRRF